MLLALAVVVSGTIQLSERGGSELQSWGRAGVEVAGVVLEPASRAPRDDADSEETATSGGWAGADGALRTRLRADLVPRRSGEGVPRSARVVVQAVIDCPGVGAVAWGQRIRGEGRLVPARASPGDAALVRVSECSLVEGPGGPLGAAAELRRAMADRAAQLPGDGGRLLPGLAIGDDSGVPDSLSEAMVLSGLSHLTAVSGANCAIVVAIALAAAAACGARRAGRIAAGATALLGFVLLVTPEPSVIRAAVMAIAVLIAMASGHRAAAGLALAVAVTVCLVVDPWLIREYGFLLSVASTAALVTIAGPMTRVFARRMPGPLAAALAVPLSAQLACQPVIAILDPAVSLVSVPANILAAPAAPLATVLGLLCCLAGPVLPTIATGIGALAWVPSTWIALCARAGAALPMLRLELAHGVTAVVFCALLSAVVVVAVLAATPGLPADGAPGRVRLPPLTSAMAAAAVGLCLAALLVSSVRPVIRSAAVPDDWTVFGCDVGQGDAVLVRVGGS
ncbi:ComEC/Rec2 family competence protein, partial [Mycetocola reblochoni]|uniref:ComEC/Rec2 family competence protein n=1 Tax=Mycetocola reblochoni TaxID=331618 RepID=UPI003F989C24